MTGSKPLQVDSRQHMQISEPSTQQADSQHATGIDSDRVYPMSEKFSHTVERKSNAPVQGSGTPGAFPPRNSSPIKPEITEIAGTEVSISRPLDYSPATTMLPQIPSHGTAAGEREAIRSIKSLQNSQATGLNSTDRRRSRSIGSVSRDSKIAALSAQLRARLSYAAAKVEKKRQLLNTQHPSSSPFGVLHSNTLTQKPSRDALARIGQSSLAEELERQRFVSNYSPNGTTVSAPDPPATAHHFSRDAPTRLSPVAKSNTLSPQPDSQTYIKAPSTVLAGAPKLAPPADIYAGSGGGQRRRPNPNESIETARSARIFHHRRHHSQQEFGLLKGASTSEIVSVPETPPLKPSTYTTTISTLPDQLDHSQNSSMEQDAIETLLFMSSPGNSGYNSNSQHSQHQQNNLHPENTVSQGTNTSAPWGLKSTASIQESQTITERDGRFIGIEAHAGDEIDRMLDQMDSDSDDDNNRKAAPFSNTPTESSQLTS